MKFLHFLERLSRNYENSEIFLMNLVMNLNPDVILTRAEQLMKVENDSSY